MFQTGLIQCMNTNLLYLIIFHHVFYVCNGESKSTIPAEQTTISAGSTIGAPKPTQLPKLSADDDDNPNAATLRHIRCAKRTLVSHHYNRLIPPNLNRKKKIAENVNCNNSTNINEGCPTVVVNKLDLLQIKEIDEEYGSIPMLMVVRQYWTDKRLLQPAEFTDDCPRILEVNNGTASYDPEYIATKVWLPDTFIHGIEEIYKPEILMKAQTFGVNEAGRIKFTMFGVFTVSCPMSFYNFPMDVQYCPIYLESWRLTEDFQRLVWSQKRPIGIQKAYSLDQFDFNVRVLDIQHIIYSTGNFSQLGVVFIFSRKLQFYILQIYFPTVLFIIISWLTFIIPPTYAQGRIILCITTMLTLAALFSLVGVHSPSTSYLKAIDVWMFVCLTFVFAAVVDCLIDIRLLFVESQSYKQQRLGFLTPVSVALVENRRVFAHFFGSGDEGERSGSGEVTASPSEFFDVTSRQDVTAASAVSPQGKSRSILKSPSSTDPRGGGAPLGVNFAAEPSVSAAPTPPPEPETPPAEPQTSEQRWHHRADVFERLSLMLYPCAFLLFNICYWSHYLTAARPPDELVETMRRGFTPEPMVIKFIKESDLHA